MRTQGLLSHTAMVLSFEKREQILKLRSKIMAAEGTRLSGEPTVLLGEAQKRIEEKYNACGIGQLV